MVAVSEEPQRPIFGFAFPMRSHAPAGQIRWLRVPGRGPWRLALLIPITLFALTIFGAALFSIAASRTVVAAVIALSIAVILAGLGGVLARAWILGTYVNDRGVRINGWWRTEFLPWSMITGVYTEPRGRTLFAKKLQVFVMQADGTVTPTTIRSADADTWLRPLTWESAVDRMALWLRENRSEA